MLCNNIELFSYACEQHNSLHHTYVLHFYFTVIFSHLVMQRLTDAMMLKDVCPSIRQAWNALPTVTLTLFCPIYPKSCCYIKGWWRLPHPPSSLFLFQEQSFYGVVDAQLNACWRDSKVRSCNVSCNARTCAGSQGLHCFNDSKYQESTLVAVAIVSWQVSSFLWEFILGKSCSLQNQALESKQGRNMCGQRKETRILWFS